MHVAVRAAAVAGAAIEVWAVRADGRRVLAVLAFLRT